ncbi:hypothetical protein JW935_20025 [candidate division KSB1 bacterium]|nr:hypothetical protein [candidate division KSB1 bacterium]
MILNTSDDEVIKQAKTYAKRNRTSLSSLVEKYFQSLAEKSQFDLTPTVRALSGILKGKTDKEIKDARFLYLKEKYLND